MNIIAKHLRRRRQQKLRERLVFKLSPSLQLKAISKMVDYILDGTIPEEPLQSVIANFEQQ